MLYCWFISIVSMVTITIGTSRQQCHESSQGIALLHHSYNSYYTQDPLQCYYDCVKDVPCQSINYYRTSGKCELNNRAMYRYSVPSDLRMDEDVVYMENPYRVPIGSSAMVPAKSCEEIKKINGDVVSGLYWVTKMSVPTQMFCNMVRIAPSACLSYTNITDANRNTNYPNPNDLCDRYLAKKWYRFTGPAGVRMPTSCVPTHHCNTDAPGWLSEPHPALLEGAVKRKVCFHWKSDCCNWNRYIRVMNCDGFYVYELVPIKYCQLRYCGSDV